MHLSKYEQNKTYILTYSNIVEESFYELLKLSSKI